MIRACSALALVVVINFCIIFIPARSHAQWWNLYAPKDFEECAAYAKKSAQSEAQIIDCDAKFAGRRKPGGGYTYFDFMQNRHFDIAGPNPNPEEQKHIDEQYTVYLEQQRQIAIAAAFLQRQREQAQAALEKERFDLNAKQKRPENTRSAQGQSKDQDCIKPSSCSWSKITNPMQNFQKSLFGSPSRSGTTASTR